MTPVLLLVCVIVASCHGIGDPPVIVPNGASGSGSEDDDCRDSDTKCANWASQGECRSNAVWMRANCRRACASCEGGDAAWRLRSTLAARFHAATNASSDHSRLHRNVSLHSLIINHVTLDEGRQVMGLSGKVVVGWNDSRLAWTRSDWGGLSWLNFYWTQIWTPTLVQTNAVDNDQRPATRKVLAANFTGEAFLWADFDFAAPCAFDYSAYPSDRQRCCFKLDDKRYYAVKMKVSENAARSASESLMKAHTSGWVPVSASVEESKYAVRVLSETNQDPYAMETSNCDICVTVQRNRAYFGGEIVGPALATALLTLLSFFLPTFWAQVQFLLASIGLQFLANWMTSSQLPPASGGTPTILKFASFNLGMTLANLVLAVTLHNLAAAKALPPPRCLKLFVGAVERLVPCARTADSDKIRDPTLPDGASEAGEWAGLARSFKFILFAVSLAIYAVVMLGCFAA